MKKKAMCIMCAVFLLSIIFSTVTAAASVNSELSGCKKVYSYSCESGAFFYGFSNKKLCSTRVFPGYSSRSVDVDGVIRAVCHDNTTAYALFETNSSFMVVGMNMNSGSCRYCELPKNLNLFYHTFAVTGDRIYLALNGRVYTSAACFDFSGKKICGYSAPEGVNTLFINDNKVYIKAYSGEIFEISGSSKIKRAQLDKNSYLYNAGTGFVYSSDRMLISLTNGNSYQLNYKYCVITGSGRKTSDYGLAFAAYNETSATLESDYNVTLKKPETAESQAAVNSGKGNKKHPQAAKKSASKQEADEPPSELKLYDRATIKCSQPISVTKLKKQYNQIDRVTDLKGNTVTSGKVKTGYSAYVSGKQYEIAVMGDVNQNGVINSADLKLAVNYFLSKDELTDIRHKAADINLDKTLGLNDLTLIDDKSQ